MKLQKRIEKLKRLRRRYLSSKTAALYLVNRKLKNQFGKNAAFGTLTDLHIDREHKNIQLEMVKQEAINTVAITGYGFTNKKGVPWLIWRAMEFDGPEKKQYADIFRKLEGIELSKKYVSLVEAIL